MSEAFVIRTEYEAPVETLGVFADIVEEVFNRAIHLDNTTPDKSHAFFLEIVGKLGRVAETIAYLSRHLELGEDDKAREALVVMYDELFTLSAQIAVYTKEIGAIPHGNNKEDPETPDNQTGQENRKES